MWQSIVEWSVRAGALYAGLGVLFAVAFVTRGVGRVDPNAEGGTWGFRLLILPGAAAFWPLLLARWSAGDRTPIERNAHRAAAGPAEADG